MFRNLSARLRNGDTDYRLLIPLLISTALVQVIVAVVRITTSYRVVELDLSIVFLGAVAAAFALLPIFLAVSVGRFIDRGHDAHTIWIGSTLLTLSCGAFVLWSSAEVLIVATAVMGVGHLMLMASQQLLCVRAAGPRTLESVFGNYMVAGAVGQGIGPYVVGWAGGASTTPPTQFLFTVGFAIAACSLVVALTVRPAKKPPQVAADAEIVPVRRLFGVPGLLAVIVAGVIMVSASDIVLIYVPLLGAERNIDVRDIGLLLTVRAAASMVARIFYARMVAAAGRWPLMIASTFACALSYAALAAPLSLPMMFLVMIVMGGTFGIAATLSITIVVDMTTANARGTGNSLRIMANRIGQFALPFGAGIVAAATGLTGLFLVLAAAIAASGLAMHLKRPAAPAPD
jgi:predicted MFS family arabinose efflux permease